VQQTEQAYSITSSARASMIGGISRPIALAVLTLITSVNLVGRSIGKSAALAPLRMRSTYIAARLYMSGRLGP
jgi:ABC-type methionine transport system permease subunit